MIASPGRKCQGSPESGTDLDLRGPSAWRRTDQDDCARVSLTLAAGAVHLRAGASGYLCVACTCPIAMGTWPLLLRGTEWVEETPLSALTQPSLEVAVTL